MKGKFFSGRCLIRFLICVLAFNGDGAATASASPQPLDYGLVDWLNGREGGYWNPKQEIRLVDPEDPTSMRGVFAKERIEQGEVLCDVPWDSLITSYDQATGEEWKEETEMSCRTVRNLIRQMKLGNSSSLAPYITYLKDQPTGRVISSWSAPGKQFLEEILGGDEEDQTLPPMDPFQWTKYNWVGECDGNDEDELEVQSAMLIVQRADEDILIPLYDMYNHQNGKLNTVVRRYYGKSHQTSAKYVIEAGEQIFNSYNLCHECGIRHLTYGTPEILKDYGFVEDFPQRWYFFSSERHRLNVHGPRLDLHRDDKGNIIASFDKYVSADSKDWRTMNAFFRTEIRRLLGLKSRFAHVVDQGKIKASMPVHEWDTIWHYYDSVLTALELGWKDLLLKAGKYDEYTAVEPLESHYNDLSEDVDELKYWTYNCEDTGVLLKEKFEELEILHSDYYELSFEESDVDTCLFLDGTVQVCTSFRPYLYETLVHIPAQYLERIERVLFVGYGNPMALTEILHYQKVELVVGIGQDQQITRSVPDHFDAESHLDDSKVQWWFGDVMASLSMLPEEYKSSFDLVILEDGVGEAESLIPMLKHFVSPNGVLASNHLSLHGVAEYFEYSSQQFYKSPIVCANSLIMASNKIDFLRDSIFDHSISAFVFTASAQLNDRLGDVHDYVKSTWTEEIDYEMTEMMPEHNASIVLNMEVVDIIFSNMSSVVESMLSSATKQGYRVLSTMSNKKNPFSTFVQMEEGHMLGQCWSDFNACNIDIFLDRKKQKLESLSRDILTQIEGKMMSSFRQVVNNEEIPQFSYNEKKLQPQVEPVKISPSNANVEAAAIEATVEFLELSEKSILVVCGLEGTPCPALRAIADKQEQYNVVPLWSCPVKICTGLFPADQMFSCEKRTLQLIELAGDTADIGLQILDSSSTNEMLQVMDSIWSVHHHRENLLADETFVAYFGNAADSQPQNNVLQRLRRYVKQDPMTLTRFEVIGTNDGSASELELLTLNGSASTMDLLELEKELHDELAGLNVQVYLRTILGGTLEVDWDFDPHVHESLFDYGERSCDEEDSCRNGINNDDEFHPMSWQTTIRFQNEHTDSTSIEEAVKKAQIGLGGDASCPSVIEDIKEDQIVLLSGCMPNSQGEIFATWDKETFQAETHIWLDLATLKEHGTTMSRREIEIVANDKVDAVMKAMQIQGGAIFRLDGPRGHSLFHPKVNEQIASDKDIKSEL